MSSLIQRGTVALVHVMEVLEKAEIELSMIYLFIRDSYMIRLFPHVILTHDFFVPPCDSYMIRLFTHVIVTNDSFVPTCES